MEIPITPEEFLHREPSLFSLYEHSKSHPNIYEDIDLNVITTYLSKRNEHDRYYLFGQLPIRAYNPISENDIAAAIELNKKKQLEYGEPANSLEIASINAGKRNFENLLKIIQRYYEHELHQLYRPPDYTIEGDNGGMKYQEIEKTTNIGK
jgi:hypothetical protein